MSHASAAAFSKFMSFSPSVTVVALAFITFPLIATPEVVVSLATVGRHIHHQNPELAAARLTIQMARGRANQIGRLSNPQVETVFEGNRGFHETKFEVGFTQRFPVTGRLRLEREISQIEIKSSKSEVLEIERRLIGQARSIVVNILAERNRRQLLREQVALAGEFSDLVTKLAAKGEGSLVAVSQARVEAASLAIEIRQSNLVETSLVGELKPLLGMSPSEGLLITGTLPQPAMPPRSEAIPSRPDLDLARLGEQAAIKEIDLGIARRYDDLEGGIFLASDRSMDAPSGYGRESIIGFQLKVPWPLWNHHDGAVQEAHAKYQKRKIEAATLRRSIGLEAETALAEMVESNLLIGEIQNTLLPLAVEQVAFLENAQGSGLGEIQEVYRARERRLLVAANQLEAIRAFNLARVRYDNATGKTTN